MEPLVRAAALHGLVETVTALRGDPDAVLRMAGINGRAVQQPESWISFRDLVAAYEYAATGTGCSSFGLRLTAERDLSYLGPLVLIFKYSDTLENGLRSSIKYLAVQNTGFEVSLDTGDDVANWVFKLPDNMRYQASQWVEESLLTSLKLLRVFLGDDYLPLEICCKHSAISDLKTYQEYFGMNVSFDAGYDGILVDRKDLDVSNPIGDRETFRFLNGYLESRVSRTNTGIAATVRSLLRNLIPTGKFSIDVVADQLGVHRRTLQRRLERSGSNYVELLDQCRSQMAIEFLQTSNLPMVNLAHMLGYADQSAFNHAFKRWHGRSPHAWRERILQESRR